MLYLGIDIAKNNHVASLIDEHAKPLFKAFSFSNTVHGANCLLDKLSAYIPSATDVAPFPELMNRKKCDIMEWIKQIQNHRRYYHVNQKRDNSAPL